MSHEMLKLGIKGTSVSFTKIVKINDAFRDWELQKSEKEQQNCAISERT